MIAPSGPSSYSYVRCCLFLKVVVKECLTYLIASINSWIRALELLDLLARTLVVTASEEVVVVLLSKGGLVIVGCKLGCVVAEDSALASEEVVARWGERLDVITLGLSSYLVVSDGV